MVRIMPQIQPSKRYPQRIKIAAAIGADAGSPAISVTIVNQNGFSGGSFSSDVPGSFARTESSGSTIFSAAGVSSPV